MREQSYEEWERQYTNAKPKTREQQYKQERNELLHELAGRIPLVVGFLIFAVIILG